MSIKYADVDITGSPFYPDAYDPGQVKVGSIPQGTVSKPVGFDGQLYCILSRVIMCLIFIHLEQLILLVYYKDSLIHLYKVC